MADLERFLHNTPKRTPPLEKAALAHVQFETIHPFLDGNGRVGRLLITLLLCAEGILTEPVLYLSLYLKQHRSTYYELLNRVRTHGEWEAWLAFFAQAVAVTAQSAVDTARTLTDLARKDSDTVRGIGRGAGSALQVLHELQRRPLDQVRPLAERTRLTVPTVNKALLHLQDLGIAREITGKGRNRIYSYEKYLELLNAGTELS
jgi:Fic family protein